MSTSLHNKKLQVLSGKFGNIFRRGFSLTEVLIALAVVAVIAVLIIPVITTRAQNRSFAVGYETEIKQMMNSLEGLPVNENKGDITKTMMYTQEDTGEYGNTSGAYINKYMKVSKYCGDQPGDCFGNEYYKYENNDRVSFDITTIKGACALLKNGVSVCLKPQIKQEGNKREYIEGWIDLTGPKGPNIYGRDLRAFKINLYQHAAFPEDNIGDIIITDEPSPCEGGECNPCEIFPTGEACCTKEGHIVSGENDLCCRWFMSPSDNPNYILCNPEVNPCDPTKENCDLKECLNHTITGSSDTCCTILEVAGMPDPKCCSAGSTSDYCCGLNPNTLACCEKKIKDKGESALSANDACCKIKSIYDKYSFCQSACEKDNNSKECCDTIARRNVVTTPDDECCTYDTVNGLDKSGKSVNNRNSYCCRLPENGGNQCCEWKYKNIGTNKDFYTKHDYNENDGTFDACCHHANYGIKSNKNEVLNRCCTVNTAQTDVKEDELCCEYLVEQLGQNKLVHGQALRRCCAYDKWKNKPQCCSNASDGMAYSNTVDWSSQCCMPNSIYNNDVTPNKNCCFAVANANGESNNFWQGKRHSGCCSYGGQSYNGKTINTIGQWQLNCCHLGRNSYPSGAAGTTAYNENCCGTKTNKRTLWNTLNKNECCETLLNASGSNTGLSQWQNNCCYGYKGGSQSTNKDYYKTEPACCNLTGNWNNDCCSISSLKGSDKWNKNCCNSPTLYSSKAVYRANCCAANTSDYTRKDHGADNPNGLNAANKDLTKHREYCCHPNAPNPAKACCDTYLKRNWTDWDGNPIGESYKLACCKHGDESCPDSCAIRSKTGDSDLYDFTKCCTDTTVYSRLGTDNTLLTSWKKDCCNFASVKGTSYYKDYCCKDDNVGQATNGTTTWDDASNCCTYTGTSKASKNCCDLANTNNFDNNYGGETFRSKCCELDSKYCNCGSTTDKELSHWINKCCISSNPGELGEDNFRGACCLNTYGGTKVSDNLHAYCCDYSKNATATDFCCKAAKDAGWNNDDFHKKCCKFNSEYCNGDCIMMYEENRSEFEKNKSTCCKETTSYKNQEYWQKQCCSGNLGNLATGDSSKDYSKYCCNGGSGAMKHSLGNAAACCYDTSVASTYCCTNVSCDYCTCDQKFKESPRADCDWKNTTCCPSLMTGYKDSSNKTYKDRVLSGCCPSNLAGLASGNNSSVYAGTCCADWASNVTGGGTNTTNCCDISKVASEACCNAIDKSNWLNTKCCKSQGTAWNNQESSYCCDYSKDANTACCKAAEKANWPNKDFQKKCCESDSKYCSDCTMLYEENLEEFKNKKASCCESTASSKKGKEDWQKICCSGNLGNLATGDSSKDYSKYCCNDGNGAMKHSLGDSAYCCYDMSVASDVCCNAKGESNWLGTKCCGAQGKNWKDINSGYCCDYSKDANAACCEAAKDAGWKNGDFHKKCCTLDSKYCSDCIMMYEKNRSEFEKNKSTCCKETTSYKDQEYWQKQCCSGNLGNLATGDSSKDYSKYCCNGGSGAMKHSLGNAAACCYDTSVASTYCCTNVSCDYCTCDQKFKESPRADCDWKNTTCCPSLMTGYKDSSNKTYKDRVLSGCCPSNLAGLASGNNSSVYAGTCCADWKGSVTGGGTDTTNCCNVNSVASSSCCNAISKANWSGTKCCSSNGKDYNGGNENNCCSWSGLSATGDSAPDNCCSSSTNTTQYSNSWKDGCCNKTAYKNTSGCCQWRYDHNIWTKGTDSCCNYVTGDAWVDGCCSVNAMNTRRDFTNSDYKECCKKLWNSGDKTYFIADDYCCAALGVDSKTGYDSSGKNYYSECHLPCTNDGIFKTDSKYTPSSTAKECCYDGGKGVVSTADNWKKYCCGMTDNEHKWSFPTTSTDKTCCDKRYSSRTNVYAYDPYYMDNACPAGGEKNGCASYGYAPFGFYCPAENKCGAWMSFPNEVSLTDTEKASCCSGWGDNTPETLKDACCAVKSDLSYCNGCPSGTKLVNFTITCNVRSIPEGSGSLSGVSNSDNEYFKINYINDFNNKVCRLINKVLPSAYAAGEQQHEYIEPEITPVGEKVIPIMECTIDIDDHSVSSADLGFLSITGKHKSNCNTNLNSSYTVGIDLSGKSYPYTVRKYISREAVWRVGFLEYLNIFNSPAYATSMDACYDYFPIESLSVKDTKLNIINNVKYSISGSNPHNGTVVASGKICSAAGGSCINCDEKPDPCNEWKSSPSSANLSDSDKASCCSGWGDNTPETLKDACCAVKSDLSYCKSCELAGANGEMQCWRSGDNFICKAKGYSPSGSFPLFINNGQYTYGFPTNNPNSYAAEQSRAIPKNSTSVSASIFYPAANGPTGTVSASNLNTCYGFNANFSVSNSCILSGSITSSTSLGDGCGNVCNDTSSFTVECSGGYTNNSSSYPYIYGSYVHCVVTGCPKVQNQYTSYAGPNLWAAIEYTKSASNDTYQSGTFQMVNGDTQDWNWKGTSTNSAALHKCSIVQGAKGTGQTIKYVQADCDGGPCTNGKTPNHCFIKYP